MGHGFSQGKTHIVDIELVTEYLPADLVSAGAVSCRSLRQIQALPVMGAQFVNPLCGTGKWIPVRGQDNLIGSLRSCCSDSRYTARVGVTARPQTDIGGDIRQQRSPAKRMPFSCSRGRSDLGMAGCPDHFVFIITEVTAAPASTGERRAWG